MHPKYLQFIDPNLPFYPPKSSFFKAFFFPSHHCPHLVKLLPCNFILKLSRLLLLSCLVVNETPVDSSQTVTKVSIPRYPRILPMLRNPYV